MTRRQTSLQRSPVSSTARSTRDASRIRALSWKVAEVERQILNELERPLPDTLRVTQLKRRKLSLKDEMRSILVRRARQNEPSVRTARKQEASRKHG